MDAEKRKRYENIAAEIVRLVGGRDNILGVAHCATRLRLVLEDNDKADTKAIEDVDLVKGVFVAGDQLQIIFGAGLVNDVCQVLADSIHMDSMSLESWRRLFSPACPVSWEILNLSRITIPFTVFQD